MAARFPRTFERAAKTLAEASARGQSVRIRGAGTKLTWGAIVPAADVELSTTALDRIVEHNAGDLTAVLEAGVPLARAQQAFAEHGQMLALDPPLGDGAQATIGGIVATADSGPLRHRYGTARDLVIGITVALSDGTIARSGGKVIKNVAGYDLGKLLVGSFGTLGAILSVNVRLHPRPTTTATGLGATSDAVALSDAARALAAAPLELDALDVAWRGGRGGLLARVSGVDPVRRVQRVAAVFREAGLDQVDMTSDDEPLWSRQRAGQRSSQHALVHVAARPSELPAVLRAADAAGGTLVGRAAIGHSYIELDPYAVAQLREHLPARATAVILDAPEGLRRSLDPWPGTTEAALELMRRVKQRFDATNTCNPGLFVGGL